MANLATPLPRKTVACREHEIRWTNTSSQTDDTLVFKQDASPEAGKCRYIISRGGLERYASEAANPRMAALSVGGQPRWSCFPAADCKSIVPTMARPR